jgi:hypothetical protein
MFLSFLIKNINTYKPQKCLQAYYFFEKNLEMYWDTMYPNKIFRAFENISEASKDFPLGK